METGIARRKKQLEVRQARSQAQALASETPRRCLAFSQSRSSGSDRRSMPGIESRVPCQLEGDRRGSRLHRIRTTKRLVIRSAIGQEHVPQYVKAQEVGRRKLPLAQHQWGEA